MTQPDNSDDEATTRVSLVKTSDPPLDADLPSPTEQITPQAYTSPPFSEPFSGQPYPTGPMPGSQPGPPWYPGDYQQAVPTNPMAVVALVLAVLTGPIAIPFAHIARRQVSITRQGGRTLATAALGIGYCWLGALLGLGLGFLVLLQFVGVDGYQPISRTVDAVSTISSSAAAPVPAPAGAAPVVRASPPPGATPCPRLSPVAGGYNQSGVGTTVTSCEFSEAVRSAYGNSGPPATLRNVTAFSSVTQQQYTMACTPESDYVVCRGGLDAVVILWAA